jgi:hypothetical protein
MDNKSQYKSVCLSRFPKNGRAKAWFFLLNNYTDEEVQTIKSIDSRYKIFGTACEAEIPNLIGYIYFQNARRIKSVKELISKRAKMIIAQSAPENYKRCCSKLGNVIEIGDLPRKGARSDIKNAILRKAEGASAKELQEEFGSTYNKFKRSIDASANKIIADDLTKSKRAKMSIAVLRKWQEELKIKLESPPNDRTVMWYHDNIGNTGKSFMARYIKSTMNGFVTGGDKTTDVANGYNGERIVVFDLTRSCEESVDYDTLEQLKNGMLFNGINRSRVKEFNIPHVVVFSNFKPDVTKLSLDRWSIEEIRNE